MDTIVVPALQFKPAGPINLAEVLELQARKLIEIGVPSEAKVTVDKFLDEAMAKANGFTYSIELANISLNRVCLVHYGVRDRFLCEVGNIGIFTDPDKFTLYQGVTVPEGFCIVQAQFGAKYKNSKPCDIRDNHDLLEQLGIPKEGLTAYLYEPTLLKESYMDFSGAVTACGYIPYLYLYCANNPRLGYGCPDAADPDFGEVSVSR